MSLSYEDIEKDVDRLLTSESMSVQYWLEWVLNESLALVGEVRVGIFSAAIDSVLLEL